MPTERIIEASLPSFHRTTLDNGVRVVTEHIPSVRSVSVGAWVGTGSRDEPASLSGISHFIEHMVFKGTTKRRYHHIAQRMEAVGGYLNAFTGKEHTCYYARALDEHLDRAIDVTCDLILSPVFPERELEKEKDVVLEEMKMYEDTPEDLVFDLYEEAMYAPHPLGRPVIGVPDTVRAFTRQDLREYMRTNYTPARTVLAISGNVDHAYAVDQVRRAFAGDDRTGTQAARQPVLEYTPRELVQRRPIQQAHLVLGIPTFGLKDPRRPALTVLNTLLGGGMSSRLSQNIREKYGFCYNIYSFTNFMSDTGDFGVYMGTDASRIDRSKKLILREIEKLANTPISKQKLNQAKNQLKGGLMLGLENMNSRMMRLGRVELDFGRYFTLDEVVDEIESVTPDAVLDCAQTLYRPEEMTVVAIEPTLETA